MEIASDTIHIYDPSSELSIPLIDDTYHLVVFLELETKLNNYAQSHVEERVFIL